MTILPWAWSIKVQFDTVELMRTKLVIPTQGINQLPIYSRGIISLACGKYIDTYAVYILACGKYFRY